MPIYEFLCQDCGVKFERLFKSISSTADTSPCPECGNKVPKVPSVANHTFVHSQRQTRGPLPSNTGTSDDWNFDKTIGRDAAEKWETINARNAHKDRMIRDARKSGQEVTSKEQLVRTRDGEEGYRVVKEPERKVINARRTLAEAVSKAASQQSPAGDSEK